MDESKQVNNELPNNEVLNTELLNNELLNNELLNGSTGGHIKNRPIDSSHNIYYPHNESDRYYIWYRESIPGVVDSTTMLKSDELLYQGVHHVKYRSKLNLYVGMYSFCLIIIVGMLLFFPLLSEPLSFLNNENVLHAEDSKSITARSELQAVSVISSMFTSTPVEYGPTRFSLNSIGIRDEKHDVLYVKLPSGMFTIQESSWDTEEKARNRTQILNAIMGSDVKSTVIKTDLGNKGTWYRTMVGEFYSVDAAKLVMDKIRLTEQPVAVK